MTSGEVELAPLLAHRPAASTPSKVLHAYSFRGVCVILAFMKSFFNFFVLFFDFKGGILTPTRR